MELNELRKKYKSIDHCDIMQDLNLVVSNLCKVSLEDIQPFMNISEDKVKKIEKCMTKHLKGIPIQKIIGYSIFSDCFIPYSKKTLTPRMETELLVEKVLEIVGDRKLDILDLCTGSGCIAIALAKKSKSRIVAGDISRFAVKQAKRNADLNDVSIEVIKTDMFSNINEKFDIIVCNPPYIPEKEYATLARDVRVYDPKLALVAQDNGLKFYHLLSQVGYNYLNKGGKLVLEIGYNQGAEVKELLLQNFQNVEVIKDYSNNDRIVIAEWN